MANRVSASATATPGREVDQASTLPLSLPELPRTIVDKRGAIFTLLAPDRWSVIKHPDLATGDPKRPPPSFVLDWDLLRKVKRSEDGGPMLDESFLSVAKLWIARSAKNWTAGTAHQHHFSLKVFAAWWAEQPDLRPTCRPCTIEDLSAEAYRGFVDFAHGLKTRGMHPSRLKHFIRWMSLPRAAGGLEVPNADVAAAAEGTALIAHGVTTRDGVIDPTEGEYTREELDLWHASFLAGSGRDKDRVLAWLFYETGMRTMEAPLLEVRDLRVVGTQPNEFYDLRRPLLKGETGRRTQPLGIERELGRQLVCFIPPDAGQRTKLLPFLVGASDSVIRDRLVRYVREANLRTPRVALTDVTSDGELYELMPVYPTRLRHSYATSMLNNGAPARVVADALGHTSLSTVSRYARTQPEFAMRVDQALGPLLGPIVKRALQRSSDADILADAVDVPPILPMPFASGRSLNVIGSIGECANRLVCPSQPVVGCAICVHFIGRPDRVDALRRLRGELLTTVADPHFSHNREDAAKMRYAITALGVWLEYLGSPVTA